MIKKCKCGCGKKLESIDKKGRPRFYFSGHYTKTIDQRGEKNPYWKGDKVTYNGIHTWIRRNYGEPTTCEHCQTGNLSGYKINWANLDHKYSRNREDWRRLCSKCHILLDKTKGIRKFYAGKK